MLHGRGSEILFPDRITAAAWRFKPCRQAVSRKDCTSRRASCPVAANYNRGWRRRQLAPSTPPGETILRTQIYSATAMLVTSQATIVDCSSPKLSVQNLPICTPPIGGSEWPTSTQIEGGYFACSNLRRHKSTRKPGPDLGDPGCRDQGVKAQPGPTKKPDRPDPAKGNRRPGRSAKLLAPGYRTSDRPPRPRAARPGAVLAPAQPGRGRPAL